MRKTLLAAALAVGALALPATAGATTFAGDCSIKGSASFTKPLTAVLGANGFVFTGTGTCTGTLDGTAVSGAAIAAQVSNSGAYLSCAVSGSMGGPGTLTFTASGKVLKFNLDQLGVLTEVPFRITGATSGLALGEASFRDSAGPATAQTCAGAGLKSLGFTAETHGVQPLVG